MPAGRRRNLDSLAAVLDLLPGPAVLVEPGTAQFLWANRAAHALAGGRFPLAADLDDFERTYRLYDQAGDPLPVDRAPVVRIARGERLENEPVDWHTPANGWRSLIVSGDTVTGPDGEPLVVVTFDDVTDLRSAERSERRMRSEFEAIIDGVADAVVAQGLRGEVVFANAAAVRLLGFDSAEALREAPLHELRERMQFRDEGGRRIPTEELPGRRALAGEDPEPAAYRFRSPGGGSERWARVKARGLRDERGRMRMAITVIEDITEIKQAELEQRFLAEAGRVLASSLDYERTLRTVAALAVPQICDWCVVDLKAPDGAERVALMHADPAKVSWVEELSRRYPADQAADTGVPKVLRTGDPEHYREIPDEVLAAVAQDEEHLRLLRQIGMTSAMIVPMRATGETVGAITMVSAESGRRFEHDDLVLAQELALRAGMAIENARLYHQRSEIARTLQASLLPPDLPEIEGVETAAVYRPAGRGFDVGGDFYDLFTTGGDRWYAVVGDVVGKGPEAAATTAMVRYTLRAAAVGNAEPDAILRALNDAMLRQGTQLRFCTLAIIRLDVAGGRAHARACSAGHPLPRVVRAGGGVERLGRPGTLVGVVPELELEVVATDLRPGDAVLAFTDGIVEARAPEVIWTMDDVDAALGDASGGTLAELLERFTLAATGPGGAVLRDDVALLGLRVL